MREILKKVLELDVFRERPPVLLDIGASGEIHPKWRQIAPYSICIVFDADEREMGYTVRESSGYRKLYVYNRIVTSEPSGEAEFFLTRSPFCSSLLRPNLENLNNWAFGSLFRIERTVHLKTVTLPKVLEELGIEKIDWFKTDSQGTDLRLFRSLGEERIDRTLVAEFESGIIDAYRGEDKLWSVISYMEQRPFWMASLDVMGSQRIGEETLRKAFSPRQRKMMHILLKKSPGWAEACYINTFPENAAFLDKRDFLLGWVFASIEGQHGFAAETAASGARRFGDAIFGEMEKRSLAMIKRGFLRAPLFVLRKFIRRYAGGEP